MYVRINVNEGQVRLQQLLSLDNLDGNGPQPKWENVPLTGLGASEALTPPLGLACGMFIFEEELIDWHNERKTIVSHYVSALSISRTSDDTNGKTRVDTFDKKIFNINIDYFEFLRLMVSMLSSFKIVSIDVNGNIKNL